MCTPEQCRTDGTGNVDDVDAGNSDDEDEFTDDEDGFVMMTSVVMSQKIVAESAASNVSFMRSMLNMLGDRLRNVPKNSPFHSPFDSKDRHSNVPLTKALDLIKKVKKDSCLSQVLIYNGYTSICCNT
jgi:hypothetical protein